MKGTRFKSPFVLASKLQATWRVLKHSWNGGSPEEELSAPQRWETEEEEPDEGSSSVLLSTHPRAEKWELDQKCQKKNKKKTGRGGGTEGRMDSGGVGLNHPGVKTW